MAERSQLPVRLAYEQMADLWPDAVVVFDQLDRRYLYANDAAERLVGYRRDEILALRPGDLAHPDDAREIPELLEQAQRMGWVRRPWRVRRKDGNLVQTEMTLTPQRVEGRMLAHGVLRPLSVDPTPVDPTSETLPVAINSLETETVNVRDTERLQVLEQTGLAVVMLDQTGIITYWNAGAAELYGWVSDEVVGRPVLDLAASDESKTDVQGLMGPPDGRDEWVTQFNIRPREGEAFPAMVTCSTIRGDDGELGGFLFVTAPLEATVRTTAPRMRRARVQCAACGREVAGTMRRKYCSEKCRQWAYYHRHLDAQRARSRQRHERQRSGPQGDAADGTAATPEATATPDEALRDADR